MIRTELKNATPENNSIYSAPQKHIEIFTPNTPLSKITWNIPNFNMTTDEENLLTSENPDTGYLSENESDLTFSTTEYSWKPTANSIVGKYTKILYRK